MQNIFWQNMHAVILDHIFALRVHSIIVGRMQSEEGLMFDHVFKLCLLKCLRR